MRGTRATIAGWLVVAATAVAACGPMDDSSIASDVERDLEAGRRYASELVADRASIPTVTEAIAAGYLERLRLGLGSPFRLIEHSLQDPRLPKPDRERLAWALLARTLDGTSYRIDPRVLGGEDVELASRHLSLIEGAIRASAEPDAGVLAVRLAYTMAAAESTVSEPFRARVYRVASLVGDRIESQEDARRLLRAAGSDTDPLALLTVWRVERQFDVEQPMPLSPAAATERDAIALAPRLLESMREIYRRPLYGPLRPDREPRTEPLLGPEAARLLALESAAYDAPPQTPVTVAVRTHGRLPGARDSTNQLFFDNALNEERLTAEYALLAHETDDVGRATRLAVLSAAVGLRAYNQERPWFPGFDGPTRRDLEDRFGLASVTFPDSLPGHWRPYYRRMLASALSDLQRVLPSLDLRGLNIRFEAREGSPGTLAVHDPRTRTIYIPPNTGAGTIAHEIAHDMDWQTALRRYRVRGDYGTDRAVRLSDNRLARVLRGLTAASLSDPVPDPTTHAGRPAEVFARSVDWFVAVALAREGRVNGYLSSVQDDVLTGYGTVTPPDVTGTAGQALVALLDEVAPVYPETRRWFLGSYGRLRAPTAYDLARRLVEPPLGPAGDASADAGPARVSLAMDRLDRLEEARDSVLALVDEACRAVGYDNGAIDARHRLVRMVSEARARSVALATAYDVAGRKGQEWMAARLEGRTRDPAPEPTVVELLSSLVDRVEAIGEPRQPRHALEAPVTAGSCGPVPFLAD